MNIKYTYVNMNVYIYSFLCFKWFKITQMKNPPVYTPFPPRIVIYIYDLDTCGYPNKCYNYVDNNEDGHEHD